MIKSLLFKSLLIGLIFCSPSLFASHFDGGEIYYKWSPLPTDSNRYEVFVNWYRDRGGNSISFNTQDVCITSSCYADITISLNRITPPPGNSPGGEPNAWLVPTTYLCKGSSPRDISNHRFSGFISLPGTCADYSFTASALCCRDGSSNLLAAQNIYLKAALNNTLGPSSSPQLNQILEYNTCVMSYQPFPIQISQSATDDDNDSLYYRLISPEQGPMCGPGVNLPHATSYSATNPISSSTPFSFDPLSGMINLKPDLVGDFIFKVIVDNYRFDPITSQWINIGSSEREFKVEVSSSCDMIQTNSLSDALSPYPSGTYHYLDSLQMDSIKQAYQLSDLYIKGGQNKVLELDSLDCINRFINLPFFYSISSSTIDTSDFKVFGPNGKEYLVKSIEGPQGAWNTVANIKLELEEALIESGNYLIQIKTGVDTNTVISECGFSHIENSICFVPVKTCPNPSYSLQQVTVVGDSNIQVQWQANAAVNDSLILKNFDAWELKVKENLNPWSVLSSSSTISDSTIILSFNGSRYSVDYNRYNVAMRLITDGTSWGNSDTARPMLLQKQLVVKTAAFDQMQIAWNDYELIPASRRNYIIEYGHYYGVDSVIWQSPVTQSTSSSTTINIIKTPGVGVYAIRVKAEDSQGLFPSSESNWIVYYPDGNGPVGLEEQSSKWIVPNILNPNGNGKNDRFIIGYTGSNTNIPDLSLKIFNLGGQLLFEDTQYQLRNNTSAAWDGKQSNGKTLAPGTYLYLIEFGDPNESNVQQLSGRLSIIN